MPNLLRDCNAGAWEDKLIGASIAIETSAPVANNTAGVATYTAAELLRGVLVRDPSGASRADVFPTAALVVAALAAKYGEAKVGMMFWFNLVNNADAAETITMTLGAGMTTGVSLGTQVASAIAQNTTRSFLFRVTNVTPAAEAMVVYA